MDDCLFVFRYSGINKGTNIKHCLTIFKKKS